jgi:histidinol-phosphate aminotransferase
MKHGGYPWVKGKPPMNINDFSVNLNPLGTPKFIEELIEDAIKIKVYKYYPPENLKDIKTIIAEIYNVEEDLIGVFNGASEIINMLGDNFTVPQPNYSEYKFSEFYYAEELGDEFKFTLKGRRVLTSNPNNPTGSLISLAEIEEFVKDDKNELILDESFIDISNGESAVKLVNEYKNLTVINSFTKSLSIPGLRFGFSIGHKSRELEKLAPIWRINSIIYYVISNMNPKEVKEFFKLSKYKVSELQDRIKNLVKFKIYKSYAPYFLAEFNLPTYIVNSKLIKMGYYIRDASNFIGLRSKHARIALKEGVEKLISLINDIVSS